MSRREELDALSSQELHDRAVSYAKHHLDVRFLWTLLQTTPAAQAASGHDDQMEYDVAHVSGQIADVFRDDESELLEAMRPIYLDYLEKHPKA